MSKQLELMTTGIGAITGLSQQILTLQQAVKKLLDVLPDNDVMPGSEWTDCWNKLNQDQQDIVKDAREFATKTLHDFGVADDR